MTTRNQFATLVIAIAATSLAADAGAITVDANIHDITANTTQDYVFTDTFGSITLRGVYTPTNNGVAAGNFTSLDGATRVGNNAHPEVGAGNHFNAAGPEGFDVTFSLLSADPLVNTSSIQFRYSALGVRGLSGNGNFDWTSSVTATTNIAALGTEQNQTLDTNFYSGIDTTAYSGSFVMTAGLTQLSNLPASTSNGVILDATFAAVPEPSTLALATLGLIGLGLVTWRRPFVAGRVATQTT